MKGIHLGIILQLYGRYLIAIDPTLKNTIRVQKTGVILWHLNGYFILMFCDEHNKKVM